MDASSVNPILTKSALLFGARLAAAFVTLLLQVVLARALDSSVLGTFFFATSLAVTLGVISAVGFPNVSNRFLARYRLAHEPDNIVDFLIYAGRIVLLVSFSTAFITVALTGFAANTSTFLAVSIAMISTPLIAMSFFLGSILNAEKKFLWANLPELLLRPIVMLGAVSLLLAIDVTPNALLLLITFGVIYGLILISQLFQVVKAFPAAWPPHFGTSSESSEWRNAATPLILMSLFANLFADLEVVVAGLLLDPAQLAPLVIAIKLAVLVGFLVQIVHQMVMPDLTVAVAQQDCIAMKHYLRRARTLTVPLAIAATLGAIVLGPFVLSIFGPSYVIAHAPLIILVAAQLLRASLGPCIQMLVADGQQMQVVIITIGSLLVLVTASCIGTTYWGVTGTAIGFSIGYAVWCLSGWMQASRMIDRTTPRVDAAKLQPSAL